MRIGTPAITTRGAKEKEMIKIVELIDEVLMNHENEKTIGGVKKKVNAMMNKFPIFK